MKSNTRLFLFLFSSSLLLIILAHHFWEREGLVWSVVFVVAANGLLYYFSDQWLLERLRCRRIEGQDPWSVGDLVNDLAKKVGVPVPALYVFSKAVPTAFALGRHPTRGAIVLSEGLLRQFSKGELRAVLAHELIKIRSRETLALTLTGALAGGLLAIPLFLDRIFSGGKRQEHWSPKATQPLTYLMAPLAGLLVHIAVSRRIYYEADRIAGELIGDPRELARVLWKLESYAQTCSVELPATLSHVFTVNPLTAHGWNRYFHCQPPIEQRIRGLVGYFPI